MKRIIFPAALAFILAGSLAFAQEPATPASDAQTAAHAAKGHHARDPHREAMQMSKKLGLTADQTAKIEPILAARQQKIDALASNTSLTDADRRKQTHAIRKDSESQLDAILTPDQQAKMKAGGHGHKKGGDAEPLAAPQTTPPSA